MYPIIYDAPPTVFKMIDTSKITVGLTDGAEFTTPAKATINADKAILKTVNDSIKNFVESLSTSTAETITYTSAKSIPITPPQIIITNADDDSINSVNNRLVLKPRSGSTGLYEAHFGIFCDVPDQHFGSTYSKLSENIETQISTKGGYMGQSSISGKPSNYRKVTLIYNQSLNITGNYILTMKLINKLYQDDCQIYMTLTD